MFSFRATRSLVTLAALSMLTALSTFHSPAAQAEETTAAPTDLTVNSRGHVDSPKIFWDEQAGNFTLKAKGDALLPLHHTVNFLDKITTGSTQEYYYTIPADERQRFLGNENGYLFWAPNNVMPRSEQLWIGFGADAGIPAQHFRDESFTLDLVGFSGPGRMELFTSTLDEEFMLENPVNRLLSSHDPGLRSTWIKPGLHTHNHTTFSQPGRYTVTYRASARLKDGQLLASQPQTVQWQVGGQDPSTTHPETVAERYNASSTVESDSFSPVFRVKRAGLTKEAPLLSQMSFKTGDEADSGSAVFYVNGHFLAEVPVVQGYAKWIDLIGPETANLQVVFIPAPGSPSPRWVSEPVEFAQGDLPNNTEETGTFPTPQADPTLPVFSFDDRTVTNTSVQASIEASDQQFVVNVTPGQGDLPLHIVGGFYSNIDDEHPSCHVDYISYPGQRSYTVSSDDCTDVHFVKLRIVPDSLNPKGGTEVSGAVTENSGRHLFTTTLKDTPHVDQSQPSTPVITPADPGSPGSGDVPQSAPQTGNQTQPQPGEDASSSTPTLPSTGGPSTDTPSTSDVTNSSTSTEASDSTQAPNVPALDATPVRISDGHLDIAPRINGKHLEMLIGDDSRQHAKQSIQRDPHAVTIEVPARSIVKRSKRVFGDSSFDFLGKEGTELYVLPATQTPGLPWPGFSTEELDYAQFPNGVTFELIPQQLPEGASWWGFTSQTFGGLGELIVNSASPMRLDTNQRTHLHLNWAFTHPGTYTLKVRAIDSKLSGVALRSALDSVSPIAASPFTTVTFHVAAPLGSSAGSTSSSTIDEHPTATSNGSSTQPSVKDPASTDTPGSSATGASNTGDSATQTKQQAAQGDASTSLHQKNTTPQTHRNVGSPTSSPASGSAASSKSATPAPSGASIPTPSGSATSSGGNLAHTGATTADLIAVAGALLAFAAVGVGYSRANRKAPVHA